MAYTTNIDGLSVDLLNIDDVVMLHQRFHKYDNWLVDTFFNKTKLVYGTTVNLGEVETQEPLAPFVSPCIEGRLITQIGAARVTSVSASYLKPKMAITPCSLENDKLFDVIKSAGLIGRNNSMQDRMIASQFQAQATLKASIDNRLTLMAAENLITGKNIIESQDFVRQVVDFGRDINATFTPLVPWSLNAATPVQDIFNMVVRFNDLTGQAPSLILTTTSVWNALVKHNDFNDTYVKPYAGISVPYPAMVMENYNMPKLMGKLPGTSIEIWTYDAKYKDSNGVFKRFIPESYFGMIGGGSGTIAYCQIQDSKAGYQPMKYFYKMWENEDPAHTFMTCVSSPLVIPSNKNMAVGGVGFIV